VSTATVLVESVDEKAGETNGKAWTKFSLKDANGEFYSTFDRAVGVEAQRLIGKRAEIEFEVNGKWKNLGGVKPVEESAISSRTEQGDADWDLIGLRKTRCVLWEAVLPVAMQAGISAWTKAAQGEYDSAQLAGFVVRFGRTLRMIAEEDIFLAPPVEEPDSWIPFLVKPKKPPQGEDVPL
jgi:hypothetical protein